MVEFDRRLHYRRTVLHPHLVYPVAEFGRHLVDHQTECTQSLELFFVEYVQRSLVFFVVSLELGRFIANYRFHEYCGTGLFILDARPDTVLA